MKAKTVNFERGQEPLKSMGIGQQTRDKKHLIAMMTDPATYASSDERKAEYKYMVQIIEDSKTKVRFSNKHDDDIGNGRICIQLPPSATNVFFFEVLGNNLARHNDVESYHWDNPDWNEMQIWINSENNN